MLKTATLDGSLSTWTSSRSTWDTALWVVMALFFAPYMIYSFMGPKGELITVAGLTQFPYRAAQLVYMAALLVCTWMLATRQRLALSGMAQVIAAAVIAAYLGQLVTLIVKPNPVFRIETLQLSLQFIAMFFGMDLAARRMSFEDFARAAAPLAFVMIVASVIHLQFFPIREWGRSLYFGLHPNFGGEMLMAMAMVCAFMRPAYLRWIAYLLSLYALTFVQSRASIIAVIILIIGVEFWGNTGVLKRVLGIGLAGITALSLVMLFSPKIATAVSQTVLNEVFFVNNPNRGLGTGFVGRDETWGVAFRDLAEAPLFGKGVQKSSTTLIGIPVHGGQLKLLAEFGAIAGTVLNIALIMGTIWAFRVDRRVGFLLLGCLFHFFFAARSINLNVIPLLMWMAILPWKAPAFSAPRDYKSAAPRSPPELAAAAR